MKQKSGNGQTQSHRGGSGRTATGSSDQPAATEESESSTPSSQSPEIASSTAMTTSTGDQSGSRSSAKRSEAKTSADRTSSSSLPVHESESGLDVLAKAATTVLAPNEPTQSRRKLSNRPSQPPRRGRRKREPANRQFNRPFRPIAPAPSTGAKSAGPRNASDESLLSERAAALSQRPRPRGIPKHVPASQSNDRFRPIPSASYTGDKNAGPLNTSDESLLSEPATKSPKIQKNPSSSLTQTKHPPNTTEVPLLSGLAAGSLSMRTYLSSLTQMKHRRTGTSAAAGDQADNRSKSL